MDAFEGDDGEYRRVLAEMDISSYDGVPGAPDPDTDMLPEHLHTKQDVRVDLPASCDPPGPANPPKQLVWIVSAFGCSFVLLPFDLLLFHSRYC